MKKRICLFSILLLGIINPLISFAETTNVPEIKLPQNIPKGTNESTSEEKGDKAPSSNSSSNSKKPDEPSPALSSSPQKSESNKDITASSSPSKPKAQIAEKRITTSLKAEVIQGKWGEAPYTFDENNGTLTVGQADSSTPSHLNSVSEAPYKNGAITASDVTKIIFSGKLVAPEDSSYLFGTYDSTDYHLLAHLSSIENLSALDTSGVTNMTGMFDGCSALSSLDLSSWKTQKTMTMRLMFNGCSGLTQLDVSSFDTSSVTDMASMFDGCFVLKELNVSNWKTDSVTDMSWMFYNCSDLTALDVSNWKTDSATDMSRMFYNCTGLTALDVSNWKTDSATDMSEMFWSCTGLTSLDVSNWKTDSATKMSDMFDGCTGLTSLDVSNWKTDSVTDMSDMFYDCTVLKELNVSNWKTDSVTKMWSMFRNCINLTGLDVSNWKTDSVTKMWSMFYNCPGLKELNVSNWKTDNVTDMSDMFTNCTGLKELNVSNWKTDNVTDMSDMFSGCFVLKELNVSNWKTDNVTDMSDMFTNCSSLSNLDLSKWDTNKASMRDMFALCTGLKELTLGKAFQFKGSAGLPEITGNDSYSGYWQNLGENGSTAFPKGQNVWKSSELMSHYDGAKDADTYVWQPSVLSIDKIDDFHFPNTTLSGTDSSISPTQPAYLSIKDTLSSSSTGGQLTVCYDTPDDEWQKAHLDLQLSPQEVPDYITTAKVVINDTGQPVVTKFDETKRKDDHVQINLNPKLKVSDVRLEAKYYSTRLRWTLTQGPTS